MIRKGRNKSNSTQKNEIITDNAKNISNSITKKCNNAKNISNSISKRQNNQVMTRKIKTIKQPLLNPD
jgi:hypothetical protein